MPEGRELEERKSSSIKRRRRKSEEASERAFFSPFPPPQPLFRFTLCFVFLLLLFPQNKTMSSLKLQRRLAASVLGVGKRALWLDPTETAEIGQANSRESSSFLFFLWPSAVDRPPAAAAA